MFQAIGDEIKYFSILPLNRWWSNCLTFRQRRRGNKNFSLSDSSTRPQNAFLMDETCVGNQGLSQRSFLRCKLGNFAVESINRISIRTCGKAFVVERSFQLLLLVDLRDENLMILDILSLWRGVQSVARLVCCFDFCFLEITRPEEKVRLDVSKHLCKARIEWKRQKTFVKRLAKKRRKLLLYPMMIIVLLFWKILLPSLSLSSMSLFE